MFPYKKDVVLECDHCKRAVNGGQVDDTMTKLKKSVSFPKYMFMGAILMVSFVTFLMIKSYLDDKEEYSYLTNPQVGDIYLLVYNEAHSEYKYYLWKAEKLFADSLYISANAYSYNMIATELIDGDGFYNSYYVIDKKDLLDLYEKGELVKVQMEYASGSGFDRILIEDEESLQSTIN